MIMKNLNISENVKNRFSLVDTNIVKGVAIILLLFHHCFLQSSVDMVGGNINFFPVSQEMGIIICHSFKLCVGIFVFLSGYGMLCSVKKLKFNIKNIAKWICTRLAKMMSGFYFVYIIVFAVTMLIDKYPIVRYFRKNTLFDGTLAMVVDFLGLAKLFDSKTLIGTWWYISAAIVFVVICPFLYLLARKLKYVTLIVFAVVIPRLTTGFPGGKSWVSFLAPIKIVRNVLHFLGNHSMNIYLVHTFFRYVYLTDFIYSFKYAVLIFLVLMLISLASSMVIEGLKKVTKYNMLTEKAVKIISDL